MSAVEIRNVKKRYKDLQALKGVSLSMEDGEFFGLLGPNGAGSKTTLISILAGLARADSGSISVRGHDVVSEFHAARRALGVVPFSRTISAWATTTTRSMKSWPISTSPSERVARTRLRTVHRR
ncbi:ABC-type multidrug transport system, ATPase component [Candidatus Burkholderia pumila]|uniref:ABC-type multidrug transport system, ATPase component n=1 Tax=Candidatus Burkholderia pumila TaxID=1090375 RepID=A0ABR5HPA0_9BURK|nr:ABC-type multidrug transport system, ATPase component [Candidatus Burkholderia pumila]